jgi:hypothetical protein
MKRIATILFACGCGPAVGMPGESSDDTTTGDTTATSSPGTSVDTTAPGTSAGTMPEPTTVATTIDPSSTTDSSDDGCIEGCCAFLCMPDVAGLEIECDLWAQDCMKGEKCTPWANDGGPRWNSTRCTPVAAEPAQLGEVCTVEGSYMSGIDDCDVGLVCLWTDPDSGIGICVAQCTGSEADPSCEGPSTVCAIEYEGVIQLCLPECDPLAPDCPPRGGCFPSGSTFVCGDPIEPPIEPDAPCDFPWDCTAGSVCIDGVLLPGCAGDRCCTPYCDAAQPEPCGPMRVCTPIYDDGSTAGYCTAP